MIKKIALFFDRTYVDAHYCFTELAKSLSNEGFSVDLYHISNPYNPFPAFYDENIKVLPFPINKFQKAELWYRIFNSKEHQYVAAIGTPIKGAWLANKLARIKNIPYFYLADEIYNPETKFFDGIDYNKDKKKDILANQHATATIALSENRFLYQKSINKLNDNHKYFIIPNAPSGPSIKLKSNFFRDYFNIEDKKPIVLFIGAIYWRLARKIFEETKKLQNPDYHLIFHARTKNQMGIERHPIIKISNVPFPSNLLNYIISSADIGLVLYDKESKHEIENGETGGKKSTFLKNQLPIIAGNIDALKHVEEDNIGLFWNGSDDINNTIIAAIAKKSLFKNSIPAYYNKHLNYKSFFNSFANYINKF